MSTVMHITINCQTINVYSSAMPEQPQVNTEVSDTIAAAPESEASEESSEEEEDESPHTPYTRSPNFEKHCDAVLKIIAGAIRYKDSNYEKQLSQEQMPHSKLKTILAGKLTDPELEDVLWHLKDEKKIVIQLSPRNKQLYVATENLAEEPTTDTV